MVLGECGARPQGEYTRSGYKCVRTGLVSLVFWLFVLDCIIICGLRAQGRVCGNAVLVRHETGGCEATVVYG